MYATLDFKTYKRVTTLLAATVLVLGTTFIFLGAASAASGTDDLAIEGYDPVAYFTMLQATRGSPEITHKWFGHQWQFSSEEHKALFVADAMRYMPNYGGYCSYDPLSLGHDHVVDPTAWRIVDDKLYLFYSERTAGHAMPMDKWQKVKAGLSQ